MASDRITGNRNYTGTIQFTGTVELPVASIGSAQLKTTEPADADRTVHRHAIRHGQKDGTDVVSETVLLHICRAPAEIVQLDVRPTVVPAGGDKQYTIDIEKDADGAGAWSSLLDAEVVVDSGETDDTLIIGDLIADPSLNAGDAIRIVITASGSTGTQGQGFVAVLNLDEQPD